MMTPRSTLNLLALGWCLSVPAPLVAEVDFNNDIRPILSNACIACHGPDAEKRKAGLRLDVREGALAKTSNGALAVTPGKPDASEIIRRVISSDPDELMPPPGKGQALSPEQVQLLRQWIQEGAHYDVHWSYAPIQRPTVPQPRLVNRARGPIDRFVLARLDKEGWQPAPEADMHALARRVSLDLTGLPPTPEEVQKLVQQAQSDPLAYEHYVDELLNRKSFGERWARVWLDLARYADSAGYADDPPRTIWAYRDYVIRSLNSNKPFDQFTREQIAGDLLPDADEEALIATAFHRNTLTNNEGGTDDEEFRNVAIVDRVNTTMAVWMGTTMACAQCHTHKYDPITQEEYFRFFAFFNNTEDSDKKDERPTIEIFSEAQKARRRELESQIADLNRQLQTETPQLAEARNKWEDSMSTPPSWSPLPVRAASASSGQALQVIGPGVLDLEGVAPETDVHELVLELPADRATTGLRLTTRATDEGVRKDNFVITSIHAAVVPASEERLQGRYVRIELPGESKMLSLAEVQVFDGGRNVSLAGKASQSTTDFNGPPALAIDGQTDGDFRKAASTTHTANSKDPWWELDLGALTPIDRIVVWNRTDGGLGSRLQGYRIQVLDSERQQVWESRPEGYPDPSATFALSQAKPVRLKLASADFEQSGFPAASVLAAKPDPAKGWAIAPRNGESHSLMLVPAQPIPAGSGTLRLTLRQESKHLRHVLDRYALEASDSPGLSAYAALPVEARNALAKVSTERSQKEKQVLREAFLANTPILAPQRKVLAEAEKELQGIKPMTTVPVFRELAKDRRETRIQIRGNFMSQAEKVSEGVPSVFHSLKGSSNPNRLDLAHWLVDPRNPLTPRVLVNRHWEQLFGIGLVSTSEEFGSQGEPPSHPKLLDWLAAEVLDSGWDIKHLLRLMVTSSTYRQSSQVPAEQVRIDPDNRLLARGPRYRLSAEMIRDQALFVAGVLSPKLYGPPVRPPRPMLGLKAAFGGSTDWKDSEGEDRYRRGLYTEWRRSMPYPSMATFDAPSREVCTLKRGRTNTPLQALVTLNDPVYVEAAQALARRVWKENPAADPATHARRMLWLALVRPPRDAEVSALTRLYEDARNQLGQSLEDARQLAEDPIGPLPEGWPADQAAAWTTVANVVLNLDELLQKP